MHWKFQHLLTSFSKEEKVWLKSINPSSVCSMDTLRFKLFMVSGSTLVRVVAFAMNSRCTPRDHEINK